MKREQTITSEEVSYSFFLPLYDGSIRDVVTNTEAVKTGNVSMYDESKGMHFDGSSGLRFPLSSLAIDLDCININGSFTILLDYNRDSNYYSHNWMIVIGTDTNKQLIGFLYNAGSSSINFGINRLEYPSSASHAYTDLNTQYRNCGFTYDGTTRKASRIINGQVLEECSITSFPTITDAHNLYIGQSSYSGDKMRGWLKNVRFYEDVFNENMLIY